MARERLLTAAEWNIMELLWDSAPKTLMELVSALAGSTGWSKSTVATAQPHGGQGPGAL